jgi:hypothetical protein
VFAIVRGVCDRPCVERFVCRDFSVVKKKVTNAKFIELKIAIKFAGRIFLKNLKVIAIKALKYT